MADQTVGEKVTEWLITHYWHDIGVVVATARNDIFHMAQRAGIPTIVFESDAQVANLVARENFVIDIGLVVWWPHIIRQPLLGIARQGFINTHPSLLPHNRGKHYNFWAIVEAVPFGVTLHWIDAGIDTGDIVAQAEIFSSWEDTGQSLFDKARDAMVQLVRDCYPTIRSLNIPRQKQDHVAGSFHASKELEPASVLSLDQSYRARDLLNLLRARTFAGHPGCSFSDGADEFEVRVDIRRKKR